MRRAQIVFLFLFTIHSAIQAQSLTVFRSLWSVEETVLRVESSLYSHPVNKGDVTRRYNIVGGVGDVLDSVAVVSFEDPMLTTELLLCEPTAIVDLPQKIVIWRENGDVYLGYMDPYFMRKRFLMTDCSDTIDRMTRLLLRIVNETIRGGD